LTARSTYEATVGTSAIPGTAASTRTASNQANALTHQEAINTLGAAPNGGTSLAFGVSAANDAKIRTANAAYIENKRLACVAEQASIQVARDVLKNTGDVGPV
jgi:hypothetical protein